MKTMLLLCGALAVVGLLAWLTKRLERENEPDLVARYRAAWNREIPR